MSIDLMEMARGAMTPPVRERLGEILGKSAEHSGGLLEAAAGLVLTELKSRAGSSEGAAEIFKTARDQDFGLVARLGTILADPGRATSFQKSGSKILESVFGERVQSVAGDLTRTVGLDDSGAMTLLSIAVPVVLGIVGRVVSRQSLNAAGLASLLAGQPDPVITPFPKAVSAGSVLTKGLPASTHTISPGGKLPDLPDSEYTPSGSIMKYAAGLCVVVVLVAGAVWYVNRPAKPTPAGDNASAGVAATDPATDSATGPAAGLNSGEAVSDPPDTVPEKEGLDLENLIKKLGSFAGDFRNISGDNAAGLADKLDRLADSLDSFGLDRLKGLSRNLFSIAAKKFLSELDGLLDDQQDDRIAAVLRPAIQKVKDKLADFGF